MTTDLHTTGEGECPVPHCRDAEVGGQGEAALVKHEVHDGEVKAGLGQLRHQRRGEHHRAEPRDQNLVRTQHLANQRGVLRSRDQYQPITAHLAHRPEYVRSLAPNHLQRQLELGLRLHK